MTPDLTELPAYQQTIQALENLRQTGTEGQEFWMARDIYGTLGYLTWQGFEGVVARATDSLTSNKIEPSHHIRQTTNMMGVGGGAQRAGNDYFLSRTACRLIAMNGDPSKPEIAGAQAYFVVQTHRMEQKDQAAALSNDEKRLELRDKVSGSVTRVSGAAQKAGVRSHRQGIFHEQRYRGLYGASLADVKAAKGLKANEQLFNRADTLELSTHNFQMELAANALANEGIRGEQAAFNKNLAIASFVRQTIEDSGGTLPEHLPLAPDDIAEVRKRVTGRKTKLIAKPKADPTV